MVVIGITGGSASGKSTLAEKIKENLNDVKVRLISSDSYFKPEGELPYMTSPVTGITYRDHNHPDSVYMEQFRNDIFKIIEENNCELLIVEGLWALYVSDVRDIMSIKMFVDLPSDERLFRRIKRNTQWGLSLDEISAFYLDSVRFRYDEYIEPVRWIADLIVNGMNITEKNISLLSDMIINSGFKKEKTIAVNKR